MTTTDRVMEILVSEGGYRVLPSPFKVGSQSFDFTHALVAGERANDLVVVVELKGDTSDESLIRKVLALTRALDVQQSKRPVTAVLTSGQPRAQTIQSISKVCRVLPVGAPTGPDAVDAVRDWLAVLLPLAQPPAIDTMVDWEADLFASVPSAVEGAMMGELVYAASRGSDAVEKVLSNSISQSVSHVLDQETHGD